MLKNLYKKFNGDGFKNSGIFLKKELVDIVDYALNHDAYKIADYLIIKGYDIKEDFFSKRHIITIVQQGHSKLLQRILEHSKKELSLVSLSDIAKMVPTLRISGGYTHWRPQAM